MHRSIHQLFHVAGMELAEDGATYDRIMAPCPTMIGRWQYVKGPSDFAETLTAVFDVANRCLSPDGTITFSHMRDASAEWAVWLSDNPNVFEEVPDSAMQVWTGYARDLHNDNVFVGPNIEYMRFKTFRRVGSNATVNDVVIPDDVVMDPFTRVEKGNFVAPVDENHPVQDERDRWLAGRGMKPMTHKGIHYDPFKYFLVEMDHDEGNYVQVPSHHPTNDPDFRWGLTQHQMQHITNPENKGTYHVISSPNLGRRMYGLWLCYWMMNKFCSPGEKVLVPFGGEGEMTLAALLYGSEVTVVEANANRAIVNEDIIIEYDRKFAS